MHVPKERRKKSDLTTPKVLKGIHMGLNMNGDGWMIWEKPDKPSVASRDVRSVRNRHNAG